MRQGEDLDNPGAGRRARYHWAEEFVNRGDRLDDLLNQRSPAGIGSSSRAAAGRLRSDTIGIPYQFRSALRAEIADKGLLPSWKRRPSAIWTNCPHDVRAKRAPPKKPRRNDDLMPRRRLAWTPFQDAW